MPTKTTTSASAMSVAPKWLDLCLRRTDLKPIKDVLAYASNEMSIGDPMFLIAVEEWKAGRAHGIAHDIYKYFIEGSEFESVTFKVNICMEEKN